MASPTNKIELIQFVKLYESHRVLWDYNDASFYDKELRACAFRDISSKFNIPVKEVKRKITNIRGILRKEKFKQRQITSSGGIPYMSKWYLYKHLTFLLDIKNDYPKFKRPGTNEVEPDIIKIEVTEDDEPETYMQPEDNHEEQNKPENDETERTGNSITWVDMNEVIQDASATELTHNSSRPISTVRTNDDVYDNFGKLIASELRKYDRRTLAYVKKAILDVIFKADTDSLDFDNK